MTSVAMYAPNYFGYEEPHPQSARITTINEQTHPIPLDDERLDVSWWTPAQDDFRGRVSAAWWGHHPHLAMPDVEVTVAMGANFLTRVPDFAGRCLEELGDDDLLVMKHPWRDDIMAEAHASLASWRWSNQPVIEQAQSYIAAGHPHHWGLFHGGMVVRRDTPAMRAFNDAWWEEYRRWSSQNQLSLPVLLRTSGIKWHTWPDEGASHARPFERGWVAWGDFGAGEVAA